MRYKECIQNFDGETLRIFGRLRKCEDNTKKEIKELVREDGSGCNWIMYNGRFWGC
jgi:hypothetical protein